jgi:3-dehydroquinate dehydratase II
VSELETFGSNYEGAILEFIHQSPERFDGYLINHVGLTAGARRTACPDRDPPARH